MNLKKIKPSICFDLNDCLKELLKEKQVLLIPTRHNNDTKCAQNDYIEIEKLLMSKIQALSEYGGRDFVDLINVNKFVVINSIQEAGFSDYKVVYEKCYPITNKITLKVEEDEIKEGCTIFSETFLNLKKPSKLVATSTLVGSAIPVLARTHSIMNRISIMRNHILIDLNGSVQMFEKSGADFIYTPWELYSR